MTVQPTVYKRLKFPAPLLYVVCLGLGYAAQMLMPTGGLSGGVAQLLGYALPGLGLVMIAYSVAQFESVGTSVFPFRPTTKLVQTGIYHISRNPIYVGMTLIYTGIGIGLDNLWILGLLVVIIPAMNWGVIGPEEKFLEEKFGQEYLRYTYQVRRWL